MNQNILNGFLKRAAEYDVPADLAVELLKKYAELAPPPPTPPPAPATNAPMKLLSLDPSTFNPPPAPAAPPAGPLARLGASGDQAVQGIGESAKQIGQGAQQMWEGGQNAISGAAQPIFDFLQDPGAALTQGIARPAANALKGGLGANLFPTVDEKMQGLNAQKDLASELAKGRAAQDMMKQYADPIQQAQTAQSDLAASKAQMETMLQDQQMQEAMMAAQQDQGQQNEQFLSTQLGEQADKADALTEKNKLQSFGTNQLRGANAGLDKQVQDLTGQNQDLTSQLGSATNKGNLAMLAAALGIPVAALTGAAIGSSGKKRKNEQVA